MAKELRDAGRGALASSNALARRAARYDFIVWGVCVVLACAPLFANAYGDSRLGRCHETRGRDGDERAEEVRVRARIRVRPTWACAVANLLCWREVVTAMTSVRRLIKRMDANSDGARAADG